MAVYKRKNRQTARSRRRDARADSTLVSTALASKKARTRGLSLRMKSSQLALKAMRRLTADYAAPEGACTSFRALYAGLAAFEADMHRHVHLENEVLFPRARRAEADLDAVAG